MVPSSDASEPAYKPGDVIAGKYQLEALLGEGGMGVVWGAINLQLEAPVAIKLLSQSRREERELLTQRLKQEARAAAKLGHPAIVRIFDVGESERGDPFIVMEKLKGRSLAAWLAADGPIAAVLAVRLLLPIADALAAAHAKGIVHRDLKPDNVFIDESEQAFSPKLVDFGIVKMTDTVSEQTHLTQSGMVLGSPDYMSPEQARGRDDIDARTDVWSFCVVLYEVVTGHTPFVAANANALLVSIALDDPRPFEPRTASEAGLWNIIQRGLAKEREQRFQSMVELGRALAGWLIDHGVHEDACGASLEAKWIHRPAELSAGRQTLASSSAFGLTPPGPVAPIANGELVGRAALEERTVPAPSDAERPASVADAAPPNRLRRARIGLALGGGVLIAAVVAFALSSPAHPSPTPAGGDEPKAEVETPAAKTRPAAESAPLVAPVEPKPAADLGASASGPSAEPTALPRLSPSASAAPSRPTPSSVRPRGVAPNRAASPREKPKTDLLSPY